MKREEIVQLLKSPPKPDIKGLKALWEKQRMMFSFHYENIEHWFAAATPTSASTAITKKSHPERKPSVIRGFYDGYGRVDGEKYWSRAQADKILEAAKLTAIKEWQSLLPEGNEMKGYAPELFLPGFYFNVSLGRPDRSSTDLLYTPKRSWEERRDAETRYWPTYDDCGVTREFLELLEEGNKEAVALAQHGFQNVMVVGGDSAALIKLPKAIHLVEVRGNMRLSNTKGPAYISSSGDTKRYYYRGVMFEKPGHVKDRWGQDDKNFDEIFDAEGNVMLSIKDIVSKVRNTEQRRVLLERYSPEDFLAGCDAVKIDGPTALGNELYRVDLGLQTTYRRWAENDPPDPDKGMKSRKEYAFMLRYTCPSTGRVYAKFVPPVIDEDADGKGVREGETVFERTDETGKVRKVIQRAVTSADVAQAWSHHFTLDEYKNLAAQS